MKYAAYSPLVGTVIYLLEIAFLVGMNYFLIKRAPKKFRRLMRLSFDSQILSVVGDAYFWYTSSYLIPIAWPYNQAGEQLTIFSIILPLLLGLNILLAANSNSDQDSHSDLDKNKKK